jgi:glucosamine--fructose-6-phosphate aminotransferase (isomerizing)
MTFASPMHQEISTVPDLLRAIYPAFDERARTSCSFELCASVKRVSIVGCGDSHHAAVGAELAFRQLAGVSARAYSALNFSRYEAGYLNPPGPLMDLVLAISVSGGVTRTVEALDLAQQVGAAAVAITGSQESPLGQVAQRVFEVKLPPPPAELVALNTPGVRSYIATQLALYLMAVRMGEVRGVLTTSNANLLRAELARLADQAEATIAACAAPAAEVVRAWQQPVEIVYVGAGPLYGTAMFSAAKMIEAAGVPTLAQETEEWAHIQFFTEPAAAPTILLAPEGFSSDRMLEVADTARTIGRQVIAVAPEANDALRAHADVILPIAGEVRECFAPLLYQIPGSLLAAEYARQLGSHYYRAFSGGRADIKYDIRTGTRLTEPYR